MKSILLILIRVTSLLIPVRCYRKRYRTWAKYQFEPIIRTQKSDRQRRGYALVCYLRDAALACDGSPELQFHTNVWECREIVRALLEEGYDVDCVNWNDPRFSPSRKYDFVLDMADYIARFPKLQTAPVKIAYMTESYDEYNNRAERLRIDELEARKGVRLPIIRNSSPRLTTFRMANHYFLLGNAWTKSTYPEEIRSQIKCLNVTYSDLGTDVFSRGSEEKGRAFLFFSGGGAVHKGLDLVLEVFARHPEWKLHIVGPVLEEKEFVAVYERELLKTGNIDTHGYMSPHSAEFRQICQQCFAFLAPSCAEGMSTAVVTTMALGLHPIISRCCGITLPPETGQYLETCSLEEIENACDMALSLSSSFLQDEGFILRNKVEKECGRSTFARKIRDLVQEVIGIEKLS